MDAYLGGTVDRVGYERQQVSRGLRLEHEGSEKSHIRLGKRGVKPEKGRKREGVGGWGWGNRHESTHTCPVDKSGPQGRDTNAEDAAAENSRRWTENTLGSTQVAVSAAVPTINRGEDQSSA